MADPDKQFENRIRFNIGVPLVTLGATLLLSYNLKLAIGLFCVMTGMRLIKGMK